MKSPGSSPAFLWENLNLFSKSREVGTLQIDWFGIAFATVLVIGALLLIWGREMEDGA